MFKELQSENLILKGISHDDDIFIHELFSNDLVKRYAISTFEIKNVKDAVRFINEYLQTNQNIKHRYVISLKSGEKIGTLYLANLDTLTSSIEISVDIRPSLWNKGYATEALQTAIGYIKNDLTINTVYTLVNPNNQSGVRLVQKLGFYRTNEQRHIRYASGDAFHQIYYKPLFTRNSWQKEFLNEGADVDDNHIVLAAKEAFKKNPSKENNLTLVNALYKQFKHHDALSFINENENNEDLLYKKALIFMKINRLEESNKLLIYLFDNFKRIKYGYKLVLTYYYLKEYKKAYDLLRELYDLFENDDERVAALFWLMATSIKLGYDNSEVKELFFKYKGELKSAYYQAVKQYLNKRVEVDVENMNSVDRSIIYYSASLFDKDNSREYLNKVLECINPWGSSCFLAALYEK